MEARDHFKNGAILKSQTSRENKKSGVNLKSVLFTFSFLILSALFFTSCKKDNEEKILPETLTVKEVVLSGSFSLKSVTFTDEKGSAVPLSDNPNYWFENATLKDITIPAGSIISAPDFKVVTKLKFAFKVDGKDYSIGVGPGSKFVVQKTKTGKYNLLPEETVKLSPPPPGS